MDASDIIAIVAAVLAAGSLGASLYGLKLSQDALKASGEATATSVAVGVVVSSTAV